MIVILKSSEVDKCVEGGKAFFKESETPGAFDPVHFCNKWKQMIDGGFGVILASFTDDGKTITGALGAVLAPNLNNNSTFATECFWFVIPEYRGHGIRLLIAFEKWAKDNGADYVAMIHLLNLQPEKIGALYERRGYKAIEVNYLKKL